MEFKWYMIGMVGFVSVMILGLSVEKYTQTQCLQTYATSNKTAQEIRKICTGQ